MTFFSKGRDKAICFLILKIGDWDFTGGPAVKTPQFQCRDAGGTGSTPAWGTKIP